MLKTIAALFIITSSYAGETCNPMSCLTLDGAKKFATQCGNPTQCFAMTTPKDSSEGNVLASKQWEHATIFLNTLRDLALKQTVDYSNRKQLLKSVTDSMMQILAIIENNASFVANKSRADEFRKTAASLRNFVARTNALSLTNDFMQQISASIGIFLNAAQPVYIESWALYYQSVSAPKTSIKGRFDCFTGCTAKKCGSDKVTYDACMDRCPAGTIKHCKAAGDKAFNNIPVVGEYDEFNMDDPRNLKLPEQQN